MTCTETFWNGAQIGMTMITIKSVHPEIRMAQLPARSACPVAVGSSSARSSAARLFAASTDPPSASPAWAFGCNACLNFPAQSCPLSSWRQRGQTWFPETTFGPFALHEGPANRLVLTFPPRIGPWLEGANTSPSSTGLSIRKRSARPAAGNRTIPSPNQRASHDHCQAARVRCMAITGDDRTHCRGNHQPQPTGAARAGDVLGGVAPRGTGAESWLGFCHLLPYSSGQPQLVASQLVIAWRSTSLRYSFISPSG